MLIHVSHYCCTPMSQIFDMCVQCSSMCLTTAAHQCHKSLACVLVEQQVPAFIPWSCRAGSCSSCVGSITSGTVDQSNQIFLDDDKIDMGFLLTCVAYPTSDVTIEVDIEAEYYEGISGKTTSFVILPPLVLSHPQLFSESIVLY